MLNVVCFWTDNFKPESIDLYKPGAIEVKADGDRKTATIERPSTVVSLPFVHPISESPRGPPAHAFSDSQVRVKCLLAQKLRRGMWIVC